MFTVTQFMVNSHPTNVNEAMKKILMQEVSKISKSHGMSLL